MEEAPVTPAPLFAVRAFKTAIFGTPHPDQSDVNRHAPLVELKAEVPKALPAEKARDIQAQNGDNENLNEPVTVSKVDVLVSPTKGILLTPGTGPIRRKTVSFGTLMADAEMNEKQMLSMEAKLESTPKSQQNLKASPRIQPRHSSLTKSLIELSKHSSDSQARSATSSEEENSRESAPSTGAQLINEEQTTENTVDLSQPRSRSGKHWKTEYEQYHKRSNREMKKIIMYGQNVKSYAVKKDSEATGLGEKLKKELSRVAAMEKKVSKLAAQLNDAYAHGPEGDSEQTRLVSELAQQTALAIRYKQKADRYRSAMRKGSSGDGSHSEQNDTYMADESNQESHGEANPSGIVIQLPEQGPFLAEMESLRMNAKKAEDQATKLEAENITLKQSLARIKGEMMSYETRRQAREERLKKREAKCKADQKACEAQLAKLTLEHRNLLLACGQSSNAEAQAGPQPKAYHGSPRRLEEKPNSSEGPLANDNKLDREPIRQNGVSKPYISPRKNRSQKSAIDIWTLSSPRDAVDVASTAKEPTELPPSSVRHDIQRTLKEIDQNLIPERRPGVDPSSKPPVPQVNRLQRSPTQPMHQPQSDASSLVLHAHNDGPPSISSPPPAVIDVTSDPARGGRVEPIVRSPSRKSTIHVGRSSSLVSGVSSSRTSTMTSGRGSALSAERAAAAKARLAARSAEKKKTSKGLGGK